MSLKVWLPLNGTLENKGVSNITANVLSGVVVDNNGKIGKCYTNSGTSVNVAIPFSFITKQFSLCAWVKINTRRNNWCRAFGLSGTGNYIGLGCEHTNGTGFGFHFYKTINGTNTSVFDTYPLTFSTGTWAHFLMAYDGTKYYIYKDGALIASANASKTNIEANMNTLYLFGGTANNYSLCSLNDVRVYDHCLSAAEVHEISLGLVLHYKLDGFLGGYGNPNLVTGSNTASTSTNKWLGHSAVGGNTSTIVTDENGNICVLVARDSTTQSSWDYLSYDNLIRNLIKTNTIYTVSFDCKPSVDGSISFTGFLNGNATNYMTSSTSTIQGTCYANLWNHMIYRCTTKASFSDISVSGLVVYFSRSGSLRGVNTTVLFKNIKVEEGTVDTPWCPADNELAIDRTHILDSSGYGHNGTITGSLTLNNNTARYSASTYISSGNTNYITTPTLQLPGDQITMNFWFRSTNTAPGSNYHMPFEGSASSNQSYEMSIYKTGYLRGGLVIGGSRKVDNCTSTKLLNGNWHMCSMTYDGTIIKRYVDGVMEKSTAATGTLVTSTSFVLGHYGSNTSYCAKEVYISDVRLYVTALSEADIKQLYELGAKVDNKHNIHAYELVESGPNKITKQGQLKGSNIHEIPDLFAYDPVLYIEPDGSQWAHIFHHNNPTSYKFASTDTFTSFVYTDENRWFNFAPCDLLPTYEFYAAVKKTSDAATVKYRWILSASPMTATFDLTKVANVTRITTTGYTQCPFGGLYHVSANTWLAMNNGTNNNWYGAVGCWTAWNGGITGWASTAKANAITTGSVDIYARIDNTNLSQINLTSKSIKTNKWQANLFIEL